MAGPEEGATSVVTGAAMYVKAPVDVALPPAVVTTTSTRPAVCGGVVTVMDEAVLFVIVPAVPPKVTLVADERVVPPIVTVVEPEAGPALGATLVTAGAVT